VLNKKSPPVKRGRLSKRLTISGVSGTACGLAFPVLPLILSAGITHSFALTE
jgi:hypothetical protein